MKVTKLFLTAAIALSLGLTACSNDDDISSGGEKEGNTNVSVTSVSYTHLCGNKNYKFLT